jgi:hypothetical protein
MTAEDEINGKNRQETVIKPFGKRTQKHVVSSFGRRFEHCSQKNSQWRQQRPRQAGLGKSADFRCLHLRRITQGRGVGTQGDSIRGEAEEQHTDSETRGEKEVNGLSRKLHALEDNLLEFPPEDEGILMFIGDADEQTLHDKAEKIRETLRPQAKAIINDTTLTLEQQEARHKSSLWN